MPIDFAAIAEQFREPLRAQTSATTPVFERLAKAVDKLAEQADAAERATRGYPVLRYTNGALCVRVTPPRALLPTAPSLPFVESLRVGGREFLGGLRWTRTAAEQELALPRLAGVGAEAVEAVLASLERFARPTPQMFDPRERRLSDLFGLLNLAYSSLLGGAAREQLLEVAEGAKGMLVSYRLYKRAFPDPPEYAELGSIDQWVVTFEKKLRILPDLLLLLPVLVENLAVVVEAARHAAETKIVTELTKLEAKVVGLRAAAIEKLIEGADLGRVAQRWLFAARAVVTANVFILTVVGPVLLNRLLTGLRRFAAGVTEWGRWATRVLEAVRRVVDGIMDFDLLGLAVRLIFPGWVLDLLPPLPRFTVDDLISVVIGAGLVQAQVTVNTWFAAAIGALEAAILVAPSPVARKLQSYQDKVVALAEAFNIVVTPRPFTLPPDVLPTGPLAGFPDVYEAFFGGGRKEALLASIDRLGVETRAAVRGSLDATATMLTDLGTTFAAEADRAASMGSPARLRELAVHAADMAEQVFGPEADAVQKQIAERRVDPLAAAFEDAVAGQGFQLVGAAIPAYVGEVGRYWAGRPRAEHPTSPHLLARRGRLGAVHLPRMTVRAAGRSPDGALASAVAVRFRSAVGEAYLAGRRELERPGEAGPARRPARPETVGGARRGR